MSEPVDTNKTGTEQANNNADLEKRIKELEAENGKLRQANTNASAEASRYKKAMQEKDDELKAKMSEDERAKAEEAERNAARDRELEELRTKMNVATYQATLTASDIGMDTDTAKAVAEALNAGKYDAVFDGIRRFITAHDKTLREDALKNNPTLPGGASDKVITREEFKQMSLTEMMAFKVDHPDLYNEYMS